MFQLVFHNKIKNGFVKIVRFICTRKIFKSKLTSVSDKFEGFCVEAQVSFKEAFKHPLRLIVALLFKIFALIIFYSLPYFVLMSLDIHLGPNTIFLVIAMTTFSIAMTCFVSDTWMPLVELNLRLNLCLLILQVLQVVLQFQVCFYGVF